MSVYTWPDNEDVSKGPRKEFLSQFTAEDDKRIMRKVDRRVLLLMGIMYLLKQIDFANAASVKVLQVGESSNILTELSMSTNDYNWTQTIYYIGLVLFEIPSNLVLKWISPHKCMTRIFLTWGIVVACHAAIQNKAGFYALRFLLGTLEAGFFPGLAAQMCSWYRSDEYGRPIMWMFAFQNCSGIIGSVLVYGLSYMNDVSGLSAWRWVFLIEGLITIVFCPFIYFILPDYPKSPSSSKWLTPDEQEYLELRLSDNAPRADEPDFSLREIVLALKDPKMYLFTTCQFLLNIAGYGLSWQLPTITTSLGFATLPRNQLLNIPPAAATVIGIIIAARVMRYALSTRPFFCQLLNGITLIFFILLCLPVSPGATYAACVLGTTFYHVYFIPFWAWRSSSIFGATGTAFAIAAQTAVAQVGGIVAPQVFQAKYAGNDGRYRASFIICTACCAAAMISNQFLWWLIKDVEGDVLRIRRERIKAEQAGTVYVGNDVQVEGGR
ncbi:major facilitator superfamily domain-containing protein [Aspergillus stella-maris]|uniref:major facilitator superfamily domain-containing protein n=1 Tax=Aspergillus stella-maris TaxID=1810926 RepID=UPI003CCD75AA